MQKDYYRILGVDRDAPEREIKRAYYALASRLHPDKAPDEETRRQNEDELALVSAAYNTLKDPVKRREYDAKLGESSSRGSSSSTAASDVNGGGGAARGSAVRRPAPPGTTHGSDLVAQRSGIAERAFAKGMQLFNAENYAEAVPFFEAAIQNDDSKAVYHIKMAQAMIRGRASYTRAVEHVQRAIEFDPYNLEYKLILANIHETAGAITAARKLYQEVLKWEPDNMTAKASLEMLDSRGSGKGFLSGLLRKLTKKE